MSAEKVLSENEARPVTRLLASTVSALAETLGSLIDREVVTKPRAPFCGNSDDLLAKIDGKYAVIRGALDKDYADKTLRILLSAQDATTLAATLMMTPDDVVMERRQAGTLEGEDLEAFGEVGNILCSGIDTDLREKVKAGAVGLRLQDHGVIRPGDDSDGLLGDGEEQFLALEFEVKIGSLEPRSGFLVIDVETAERWNGQSIFAAASDDDDDSDESAPSIRAPSRAAEGTFEDIPAATIRGAMTCYATESKIYDIVRRSCRRVGLELDRGGRGEVPNPSALHGRVVLLDVPVGEERRFDWCKRLKGYDESICVVLLIHMPSRSRVLQAFMAKANAILAWPVSETELSNRLASILDEDPVPAGSPTAAADDAADKD